MKEERAMLKKLKKLETLIFFALYLIPILLWSVLSFRHMILATHWTLLALGLLLASFGSLSLWFFTKKEATPPLLPTPKPTVQKEIVHIPDPAQKVEIAHLKEQIEELKIAHQEDLLRAQSRITAQYQGEREDKERQMEQSQEKIRELESKIGELEYEIKTLIDFNEDAASEGGWLASESDASGILKKWLDAAANTDAEPFGKLIQKEGKALVFLYGLEQGRILQVNSHAFTLFGLTPEQFARQFHTFLPKESLLWHETLQKTHDDKWAEVRLADAKGVLAAVQAGPLKGHLLGVVY